MAEGLCRAGKDRDVFDPSCKRIAKATHIRHEGTVFHARLLCDLVVDLIGVLQGWNNLRAHKLPNLDRGESCIGQTVNQVNTKVYRNEPFDALESIACSEVN